MIKDVPNRMQKFRKYQGEIRRPSLNEQCKETEEMIEMERLEISSRKLEKSRKYFIQA